MLCKFEGDYHVNLRRPTVLFSVKVYLNGIVAAEVKRNPKHKKNAEIGQKNTVYASIVYVEQKDALSFADQEEACFCFNHDH